jgi:hypothetical protein
MMLRSGLLLWFLLAADGAAAVSTTTRLAVTPLRSTLSHHCFGRSYLDDGRRRLRGEMAQQR